MGKTTQHQINIKISHEAYMDAFKLKLSLKNKGVKKTMPEIYNDAIISGIKSLRKLT